MIKRLIKKMSKAVFPLFSCFFTKKASLNSHEALTTLAAFSPKPTGEPVFRNTLQPPICDLQIIIPAYNVENYLRDCLESILSQKTKFTYKVVLINDGSTDNTAAIADQYRAHENVIVIDQENKGFSGARNTGLRELFGKYIMFVDSDDMLCPGAIDALLQTAFEHDCDIVEGGAFSLREDQRQIYFSYPKKKALGSALGKLHGQPWAKVFKAECFQNLVFPEGFWFEDSILSLLIYPVKKRVWIIDQFTYLYRLNPKGISLSSRNKAKSADTYWITEKLMETQKSLGIPADQAYLENFLAQLVLNQKRLARLPLEVQQSAFVLSCDLLRRYFSAELINANKHRLPVKTLSTRDWGMFRFYCRF